MKKKNVLFNFIFILALIILNLNIVNAATKEVVKSYSLTKGATRTPTIYEKNGVMEFVPTFSCDLGSASEYLEIKGINIGNSDFGNILVKKVPTEKKTYNFTCKSSTRFGLLGKIKYNITLDLYPDAAIDKNASTYTGTSDNNNNNQNDNNQNTDPGLDDPNGTVDQRCEGIFGSLTDKKSLAYMLHKILNFLQFLGPILVIALSIMDLVKAVASNDKDALSKFLKTTAKRLIYAIILFIFPPVLDAILRLTNVYGTCGL